jgi:hypothetical protein
MPPPLNEAPREWRRYLDFIPIRLKALLQEPDDIDEATRERARKRVEMGYRDEHEALETAIGDLIRLDRYQRRAWSRQKRAIREFNRMKIMGRDNNATSAVEERVL